MTAAAGSATPVTVWYARPSALADRIPQCERLLAPGERERALRFREARHRAEYVVAHAMLRTHLANEIDQPAAEIEFATGRHGKPYSRTDWGHPDLAFNLTHAEDLVLVAVGRVPAIGIDAESARRPIDWAPLARRYFSPSEQAAIDAVPAAGRHRAFMSCWVRKEAVVKAHGGGIAVGLDTFDVNVDPDEPPRVIAFRGPSWAGPAYRLIGLDASVDHICALATRGPPVQIVMRHWTPPEA